MKNPGKLLLVVTLLMATSAMANNLTYQLTEDHCTGGCNPGAPGTSMGTVLLEDIATGNVKVTITLVSPLQFVNTGLQDVIDFNLGSITSGVTADGFTTDGGMTTNTHFSLDSGTAGTNHFDGFGDFQYAIGLDTGTGAPSAQPSPLSFNVHATGLTTASFVGNAGNWYFGVDVINTRTGRTGPIGAGGGGTQPPPVPEPASLMLLGSGLTGMGALLRRRTK